MLWPGKLILIKPTEKFNTHLKCGNTKKQYIISLQLQSYQKLIHGHTLPFCSLSWPLIVARKKRFLQKTDFTVKLTFEI